MNHRSLLATPLEIAFRTVGARLRASRTITRWLFGVDPLPGTRAAQWDMALLALRGALLQEIQGPLRVLEVGTGDLGLLSLFLARHRPEATITAVDINPTFAANARRNAAHNRAAVDVRVSDLFGDVPGPFDLVVTIPPYVPTDWGRKHARWSPAPDPDCVWDGGPDGLDLVRRFLAGVHGVLAPGGRVLLTTSDFYHSPAEVERVLTAWEVLRTWRGRFNPTRLWVLTPARGWP